MITLKRFVTIGSLSVLGLFGLYVVSAPFLREPPAPAVQVTIEPQPSVETAEPLPEAGSDTAEPPSVTTVETTPAYETGVRTGEQLDRLWTATKEFGSGLWSALTEKE